MAREKLFNVRLSEPEWENLQSLADYHGVSCANVIRMLLKKEGRELVSAPVKKVKSRKK